MGNTYSVDATREGIVIKTQVDNADMANDVFKLLRKNPDNSIRARSYDTKGRVVSEKFYGEDPDWWAIDDEWNDMEKRAKGEEECDVYKVDLVTHAEEHVASLKNRSGAITWIAFEAQNDKKFGVEYIFVIG